MSKYFSLLKLLPFTPSVELEFRNFEKRWRLVANNLNTIMDFYEYIKLEHGDSFRIDSMFQQFEEDEITEIIHQYLKKNNEIILQKAKENARFESGTDKEGFIYISQLEELLA